MPAPVNIAGLLFGHVTALRFTGEVSKHDGRVWLARCVCGIEFKTSYGSLAKRKVTSCGCMKKKRGGARFTAMNTTHGMSKLPEYKTWKSIKDRVGKGPYYTNVKLHASWTNDFPAFYAHVGPRPSSEHSLDRIDNLGHYEPGNVRWATRVQQANNRRPHGSVLRGRLTE